MTMSKKERERREREERAIVRANRLYRAAAVRYPVQVSRIDREWEARIKQARAGCTTDSDDEERHCAVAIAKADRLHTAAITKLINNGGKQ